MKAVAAVATEETMRPERRLYSRHAVTCRLTGTVLRTMEAGQAGFEPAKQRISGEVADIGAGGLCLLTADRAEMSRPLRCEIVAPEMPAGIPTLMQVRWTDRSDDGQTYRVGMQFLV